MTQHTIELEVNSSFKKKDGMYTIGFKRPEGMKGTFKAVFSRKHLPSYVRWNEVLGFTIETDLDVGFKNAFLNLGGVVGRKVTVQFETEDNRLQCYVNPALPTSSPVEP